MHWITRVAINTLLKYTSRSVKSCFVSHHLVSSIKVRHFKVNFITKSGFPWANVSLEERALKCVLFFQFQPALDFQKLKADLYVDLSYTNNLLRQRVHRDNLTNLVAQITECLRLIRCRVATAAAYIQTDGLLTLPTSASASNVVCKVAAFRSATTALKPERHYYRRVHIFHPFLGKAGEKCRNLLF